ncbi:hypothetical protein NliqN6_6393 [Naganishia liquefaciens]|uniref:RING-type E3 ubiquitin transferase n=1 Tax=Naganishia liquefaciens TaxID=104408 RepID=A0A8H3TZX4_9TREE|nr:hypothetical protein NliqN6_6393 [Naganishia liquefaciens]
MPILQSKLLAYGVLSTGLALAVLSNAWNSRRNFYASAVQVASSNGSLLVLANFALFVALTLGTLVKRIFFGTLRPIEIEHLYDRSWYFFTETILALTMFRDDLDVHLVVMFSSLLFLKCFHWISTDRVDYMDQFPPPGPPIRFHLRLLSAISSLAILDVFAVIYCYRLVIQGDGKGAISGASIFFGTEFAILTCTAISIHAKYFINLVDIIKAGGRDDAPPWEGKSMWTFYVDLTYYGIKLVIYTAFFYTIFFLSGVLPINHIVPLYLTFRAFSTKCLDLVKYRRATRNMDTRYPDATQEEIDGLGGGSCVICREDMVATDRGEDPSREAQAPAQGRTNGVNDTPKKLGCGHVFHLHCLRSWLERQQSCPTCRRTVFESSNAPAVRAPRPAQTPVAPPIPQATASGQLPANDTAAAAAPQPSSLRPAGIWRSEVRSAPSPITQFRRRISELMSPPAVVSRDLEEPAIHVAAPTSEQATALQSLPWEALTMAQRQREIRSQPSLPSHLNPQSGATLRPLGSRNVSWDPSNGIESPWASHTPISSQAPEVFSQIHATRVQTRSQSRLNGSRLSKENSIESVGIGPDGDNGESATAETASPAQMAAMAALRRANQQRTPSRSKPIATAVSSSAEGVLPISETDMVGAFDDWNRDRETPEDHKDSIRKKMNVQLIPLFVDPVQTAQLEGNAHLPIAPLSPRSVMTSIRWGVDQLRRSQLTGADEEWRSEAERLKEAHRDLGTAIADLSQDTEQQ